MKNYFGSRPKTFEFYADASVNDCRMRGSFWRLSAQYKMFAAKGQTFSFSASCLQHTMSTYVYGYLHSPWDCCVSCCILSQAFTKAIITCTVCKYYIFIEKSPKWRRKGGKIHCSDVVCFLLGACCLKWFLKSLVGWARMWKNICLHP